RIPRVFPYAWSSESSLLRASTRTSTGMLCARAAPMALTVRTAHSPAAPIARTLVLPVLVPGGLRRFPHVLVEELERRAVRRDVVLLLDEPVALVGKHHILRHAAAAPHRLHDLVGLDLQHPRIVRSLKHEQRLPDRVRVEQGR